MLGLRPRGVRAAKGIMRHLLPQVARAVLGHGPWYIDMPYHLEE